MADPQRVDRASLGAGPLLRTRPRGPVIPSSTRSLPFTRRISRLTRGRRLVHADLHNHSLLSDGAGEPASAFVSMRAAGLDVAALTEHARIGWGLLSSDEGLAGGGADGVGQTDGEGPGAYRTAVGIDDDSWHRLGLLADHAHEDGTFVAIRGFEWSSPSLGHLNVWLSRTWIDPLHTGGLGPVDWSLPWMMRLLARVEPETRRKLAEVVAREASAQMGMGAFYRWLDASPSTPGLGGGLDGLAGFNHPGRDSARFSGFALDSAVQHRVVSIEVFNRDDDYLFEGIDAGEESPISQCLNSGWMVGLSGVTDEHGASWGSQEGLGRTGLWVGSLTRLGVREALRARRFFAARGTGLRLDAVADGVRMGAVLPARRGRVRFALDVDRGRDWVGRLLNVQVLSAGEPLPTVLEAFWMRVRSQHEPVVTFEVMLDPRTTPWIVLRITDPQEPPDPRARAPYDEFGGAIAYTSPFFMRAPERRGAGLDDARPEPRDAPGCVRARSR